MTKSYAVLSALALAFATSSYAAPPPHNVNVINTPLPVRDVDNAPRSPIQFMLCASIIQNLCAAHVPKVFNVPSDRRLVIEFVSATCSHSGISSPHVLLIGIGNKVGGVEGTHWPILVSLFGGLGLFEQARIYADAGSKVELSVGSGCSFDCVPGSNPFPDATCVFTFSGYTVAP